MLSTLTSYRIFSNDISKSLARVQAEAAVTRDSAYYKETIGKVKTVDEFLGDQRLYTYALKAYGLSDQASAKGFMRKVIESDLSDTASFANTLNDARYRQFAAAFNFKASAATTVAQSTGRTESLTEAYSERHLRGSIAAAAKTKYFETKMSEVKSIDDLLDDSVLYDVALRSVGLDPTSISKDYVKGFFTQFAGVDTQTGLAPLAALAARFRFGADGTIPAGERALSAEDTSKLVYDYFKATDNTAGPAYAAYLTGYFNAKLATIDSADDITSDPRLFEYVTTAFGLTPGLETPAYIQSILTSDPADPQSVLARLPTTTSANVARKELLTAMSAAFNFAANGSLEAGKTAQTTEQTKRTEDGYYAKYQAAATAKDATHISTFKLVISRARTLSDLMGSDPAFGRDALNVALEAFDIEPGSIGLTQIRRILESDVSDPDSYVNRLGDERFKNLAAAFNFSSDGNLRTERLAQSVSAQAATGTLYATSFGTDRTDAQKAQTKAETKAYLTGIGAVDSLDEFLKSGKTLTYALTAYGLGDEPLDETKLRKILTSDLGDKTSYVYSLKDTRYEKFAAAFNFTSDGKIGLETGGVQTASSRLSTQNLYLLQSLEEKAGEQNEGTRLALYFLRKSPDIKSTVSLLADKALLEVVKTALSLPDGFSQLDIDKQVKIIEKKLNVADLQDKGKLDKFVARFAALYDMKNASGASSPLLALFSGGSETSILSVL